MTSASRTPRVHASPLVVALWVLLTIVTLFPFAMLLGWLLSGCGGASSTTPKPAHVTAATACVALFAVIAEDERYSPVRREADRQVLDELCRRYAREREREHAGGS